MIVLVVAVLQLRLRDSRLGRAWMAIREDELAAAMMGVHLVRSKLLGVRPRRVHRRFRRRGLRRPQQHVNVDHFDFAFSIFILCMVILGGMGNSGA